MIAPILICLAVLFLILTWVAVLTLKVGLILTLLCVILFFVLVSPYTGGRFFR